MQFDLEERTKQFSFQVIRFIRTVSINSANKRIVDQVIGASSSIGANYREASEAESRKDFFHKIGIAQKEIKEAMYWIELLAEYFPDKKPELRVLWKEARELLFIFIAIRKKR